MAPIDPDELPADICSSGKLQLAESCNGAVGETNRRLQREQRESGQKWVNLIKDRNATLTRDFDDRKTEFQGNLDLKNKDLEVLITSQVDPLIEKTRRLYEERFLDLSRTSQGLRKNIDTVNFIQGNLEKIKQLDKPVDKAKRKEERLKARQKLKSSFDSFDGEDDSEAKSDESAESNSKAQVDAKGDNSESNGKSSESNGKSSQSKGDASNNDTGNVSETASSSGPKKEMSRSALISSWDAPPVQIGPNGKMVSSAADVKQMLIPKGQEMQSRQQMQIQQTEASPTLSTGFPSSTGTLTLQ